MCFSNFWVLRNSPFTFLFGVASKMTSSSAGGRPKEVASMAATLAALLEQAVADPSADFAGLEEQLQLLIGGHQRHSISDELLWTLAALALTPLVQRPWPSKSSVFLRSCRTLYALLPQPCPSEQIASRVSVFLKVAQQALAAGPDKDGAVAAAEWALMECRTLIASHDSSSATATQQQQLQQQRVDTLLASLQLALWQGHKILQTNLTNELLSGMPLGKLPRSSCIKAALLTSALLFEHVLKNSEGSGAGLAAATLGLADLHSQLSSVIERLKHLDAAAAVGTSALQQQQQQQQEEEACRTGLAALVDMQAQVLRLLIGAYLKAGEAKKAISLVDTYLASAGLGTSSWDVWLLGIQARVALDTSSGLEAAACEVARVASLPADSCPLPIITQALTTLIRDPQPSKEHAGDGNSTTTNQAALPLAVARVVTDTVSTCVRKHGPPAVGVLLDVCSMLLGHMTDLSPNEQLQQHNSLYSLSSASAAAVPASALPSGVSMVLSLLGEIHVEAAIRAAGSEQQERCYVLLHSQGTMLLMADNKHVGSPSVRVARDLFAAAMLFAPASARGKAARMLATCDAALNSPASALSYLDLAEQHEPGLAITQLMRLKLQLSAGEWGAAEAQVAKLTRAWGLQAAHLQAAYNEAMGAASKGPQAARVAAACMQALYSQLSSSNQHVGQAAGCDSHGPTSWAPTTTLVCRQLVEAQLVLLSSGSCFSYAEVESLLQEVAASLQSCAALLSTSAGQPGNTEDLQELYMMAVHVGQVSLALKAWRPCAEATGAAVTFATATKLKEAQAQVAAVVAVFAILQQAQTLEEHAARPALALAEQLSRAHLQPLGDPMTGGDDQSNADQESSKLSVLMSLLKLHLAVMRGDGPAVRSLMQGLGSTKGSSAACTQKEVLRIAQLCMQPGAFWSNTADACMACGLVLRLAKSQGPDVEACAEALYTLYTQGRSGQTRSRVCKTAVALFSGQAQAAAANQQRDLNPEAVSCLTRLVVDAINHAASLTLTTGAINSPECSQAWEAALDAARAAAAAGLQGTSLAGVVEQAKSALLELLKPAGPGTPSSSQATGSSSDGSTGSEGSPHQVSPAKPEVNTNLAAGVPAKGAAGGGDVQKLHQEPSKMEFDTVPNASHAMEQCQQPACNEAPSRMAVDKDTQEQEQQALATQPDAVDVVPATPTGTQDSSDNNMDSNTHSQQQGSAASAPATHLAQPSETAVTLAAVGTAAEISANAGCMQSSMPAPAAAATCNTSPGAGGEVIQAGREDTRGGMLAEATADIQHPAGAQHKGCTGAAECTDGRLQQDLSPSAQPPNLHNSTSEAAGTAAKLSQKVSQKRSSSSPPPSPLQPMKRQLMNAVLTESVRAALDDALEDIEALSISQ